jgi:hypothetical protein
MSASTSEPRLSMERRTSPQAQSVNTPRSASLPAPGDYLFDGLSPITTHVSTPTGSNDDTSLFEPSFWNETVPRLVEQNSAVRLANEAVHILILAKQPSLMASFESTPGEDHYSGALRRYGTALREMRETSIMQGDVRPALLCSMFFVIFEIINGDQAAAESHLSMGQRMMDELQPQQGSVPATPLSFGPSPTPNSASQPRNLRKELKHVLRFLALQARSHGVVRWEREMRRQTDSWDGGFDGADYSYWETQM